MARDALVVLGCGWIARRHAAAARRVGMPTIFASRDAERARRYVREFGGLDAVGDYAEALAHPRALAAVVCTPHDRHLADTLAALAAGRHVLVEKPIARTLEEADQMLAAAAAARRILMVAENFRWMPGFRAVRTLLDRQALGGLREVHLVARGYRAPADWRASAARMGGGALIDGGIHYVHALRWWGGEVRSVYAARPAPTHPGCEGEDAITVVATLLDGGLGLLSVSLAAAGVPRLQCSTLTGTRAACFVDNRGRFLVLRGRGGTRVRVFLRDVRGHVAMLRAFQAAITTGRPPETDGVCGRRDLAVVLAAYRALAEGRPVEVAA